MLDRVYVEDAIPTFVGCNWGQSLQNYK